jgi:large subunit ribosomal protein L21
MHAVVRLGSHQYLVTPGKAISIEKIEGVVGSEVRFKDVVFVSDGEKVQAGKDVKATVVGTIKAQLKGAKIVSFKRIRRKGFQKTIGHRQPYTTVAISRIEA